ncbi:hypothetical protein C8R45DRAFT_928952 [Mycena sanguinolenta]|nr:hypothetical protein C8R45DRAFT_928952 [Mycena sanguinolenta]
MTRKQRPFLCGCGCGEIIKTRATERRHLDGKGPLYVQYSAPAPSVPDPGSPVGISGEDEMDIDGSDAFDFSHTENDPMDIDEHPDTISESSHSDSESDDGFFNGEDDLNAAWDSDASSDANSDWDEGEEPWQEGLSQSDRLGGIFEAEAARAALNLSADELDDIRAFNFKVETQITDSTYEKLGLAFPQLGDLSSLYSLRKRMAFLSGVKPVKPL